MNISVPTLMVERLFQPFVSTWAYESLSGGRVKRREVRPHKQQASRGSVPGARRGSRPLHSDSGTICPELD